MNDSILKAIEEVIHIQINLPAESQQKEQKKVLNMNKVT